MYLDPSCLSRLGEQLAHHRCAHLDAEYRDKSVASYNS